MLCGALKNFMTFPPPSPTSFFFSIKSGEKCDEKKTVQNTCNNRRTVAKLTFKFEFEFEKMYVM